MRAVVSRWAPMRALTLMLYAAQNPALVFHDVPANGDCLFSAVSLSAALIDNRPDQARARALRTSAERLRNQAMDLLCPAGSPDPELVLGGLPAELVMEPRSGEDAIGYCKRMRQPGEWGSTAELMALTRVLGRPIRVHTEFSVETYGAEQPSAKPPLSVHFADSHYRAVTEPPPAEAAPEGATVARICGAVERDVAARRAAQRCARCVHEWQWAVLHSHTRGGFTAEPRSIGGALCSAQPTGWIASVVGGSALRQSRNGDPGRC